MDYQSDSLRCPGFPRLLPIASGPVVNDGRMLDKSNNHDCVQRSNFQSSGAPHELNADGSRLSSLHCRDLILNSCSPTSNVAVNSNCPADTISSRSLVESTNASSIRPFVGGPKSPSLSPLLKLTTAFSSPSTSNSNDHVLEVAAEQHFSNSRHTSPNTDVDKFDVPAKSTGGSPPVAAAEPAQSIVKYCCASELPIASTSGLNDSEWIKAKKAAAKINADSSKKSWSCASNSTAKLPTTSDGSRMLENGLQADSGRRPDVEIKVPKNMMLSDHCKLCEVRLSDASVARAHYSGKRHALREDQYVRTLCRKMGVDPERYLRPVGHVQSGGEGVAETETNADNADCMPSTTGSTTSNSNFSCLMCRLEFDTYDQVQTHVKTPTHIFNIREYENKLKRSAKARGGSKSHLPKKPRGNSDEFFCSLCETAANSSQQFSVHLASKKHKKNVVESTKHLPLSQLRRVVTKQC